MGYGKGKGGKANTNGALKGSAASGKSIMKPCPKGAGQNAGKAIAGAGRVRKF